jgi:hypothetical protein
MADLMALVETMTTHGSTNQTSNLQLTTSARRVAGLVASAASAGGWVTWLVWRLPNVAGNPISLAMFALELASFAIGIAISVGIASHHDGREAALADDSARRFAFAVADLVGRARSSDLHGDVRAVAHRARAGRPPRDLAGVAIAAVLLDGPRRLLMVLTCAAALLLGLAPFSNPPAWALAAAALAMVATSISHVLLGEGRIRIGDRVRYSCAAVGEVVSRVDRDGLAPRRWTGAVASVVVINLAIGLRGISDRWTHGLPAMSRDGRIPTLMVATLLVLGALYTLSTTPKPVTTDAHLCARHLDERTARHSLLWGAICLGLVGLMAGVLPMDVDSRDGNPGRIENVSDRDPAGIEGITGG